MFSVALATDALFDENRRQLLGLGLSLAAFSMLPKKLFAAEAPSLKQGAFDITVFSDVEAWLARARRDAGAEAQDARSALASAHEDFERINTDAQQRYRAALAALIEAARPELSVRECGRRAADIDVIQNGLWLTAILGLDPASVGRAVQRCEEIAFGSTDG